MSIEKQSKDDINIEEREKAERMMDVIQLAILDLSTALGHISASGVVSENAASHICSASKLIEKVS